MGPRALAIGFVLLFATGCEDWGVAQPLVVNGRSYFIWRRTLAAEDWYFVDLGNGERTSCGDTRLSCGEVIRDFLDKRDITDRVEDHVPDVPPPPPMPPDPPSVDAPVEDAAEVPGRDS